MEYSLHDHIELLKSIEGVKLVYATEPDYSVYQQIGDIPSIAFNVVDERELTFVLVVPNDFLLNNSIEPAKDFIPQWFDFLENDPQGRTSTTFNFRPHEGKVVQLKGSLKLEDIPENAQKLADLLMTVDHVIQVKIRKLIDPFQLERANCQNAFQYFCAIDLRTAQSVPAINLYVPEHMWNNPEKHHFCVDQLVEQVKIREENGKILFKD
jgi:hypothetical protein